MDVKLQTAISRLIMEITFNSKLQRNSWHQKIVHLRNDDKRLRIDRENQFFHIKVTFSNLRHPQFCIEDNFLKIKGGNLFANLQQYFRLGLRFPNTQASRTMLLMQKSMNARVTSNVGDCFSKFYLLCFV